jgi:Glycosyl hydrolase family 47
VIDAEELTDPWVKIVHLAGGLLSAHLFAVGELPVRGYTPPAEAASFAKAWNKGSFSAKIRGIKWPNGFVYNGQLLRLARDLGDRLLPAFYTETGLPYPRVSLRHGVLFYPRSPINPDIQHGDAETEFVATGPQSTPEVTETCSAGAGSLVLEFTVLSRLTGDGRYEELAKRAFWAVWARRSDLGLIGAGIDAESGRWVTSYTGVRVASRQNWTKYN